MNDEQRRDEVEASLMRRLQDADPARTFDPAASRMPDLVEAAMSTSTVEPETRSRWRAPAMAAAVALAVVGVGAYAFIGGNEPANAPASTVTTLALPAGSGTSMSSCIAFDVQFLRDMPIAFSGSATEVNDDSVTLEVDRWYKGGDADVVRLANYDSGTVSIDGFTFDQGDRYLITATDGTVNFCGFSGPWTQDLADAFDEAFRP